MIPRGRGKGGRNQHLALQFSSDVSLSLHNKFTRKMNISLLCFRTGGYDGNTDVAGAIGTNHVYEEAIAENLNLERYLKLYNSYTFFSNLYNGKYFVKCESPAVNVTDMHIMLINKNYDVDDEEDRRTTKSIIKLIKCAKK